MTGTLLIVAGRLAVVLDSVVGATNALMIGETDVVSIISIDCVVDGIVARPNVVLAMSGFLVDVAIGTIVVNLRNSVIISG